MVFPVAAALGVASIGASLLGSGKSKTSSIPTSGFATLPKEVQDAYLKTFLPAIMQQFQSPRQEIPLARAEAPKDIFDSQELWKYQQFKDAQRLRNTMASQSSPVAQATQQNPMPQNQQSFEALLTAINPNYGMTNPSGQMIGGTAAQNQLRQKMALEEAFKKYLGGM